MHFETPVRFFVNTSDELESVLGITLHPGPSQILEHVYFDTAHPKLPFTGHLRARRFAAKSEPPFDPTSDDWRLDHQWRHDAEVRTLPNAMRLADVPPKAAQNFNVYGTSPRFGVRFKRTRSTSADLIVDIDQNVTYFALTDDPFEIGREKAIRVTLRHLRPRRNPKEQLAFDEAVASIETLPYTTKKWMGYSYAEAAFRHPKYNELAGFEYEAKLDADHLRIDVGNLAFPVLEVLQSDSIRRYYKGYRANTRAENARIIRKGKVVNLDGVLKRTEVKEIGLSAWEMSEPVMEMRRYKRKLNVINPTSRRVYTVSLHHCEAQETLQQVEVEYEGTLAPGVPRAMSEFRATGDVRLLFDAAQRVEELYPPVARDLYGRVAALAPKKKLRRWANEAIERMGEAPTPDDVDPEIEAEVVNDLLLIRDDLSRQYGFVPTRITKRKWLKGLLATAEE